MSNLKTLSASKTVAYHQWLNSFVPAELAIHAAVAGPSQAEMDALVRAANARLSNPCTKPCCEQVCAFDEWEPEIRIDRGVPACTR